MFDVWCLMIWCLVLYVWFGALASASHIKTVSRIQALFSVETQREKQMFQSNTLRYRPLSLSQKLTSSGSSPLSE